MSKKPLQIIEAQEVLDKVRFEGGTAIYDAIGETCTKILSRSGNPNLLRRTIILITDGEDNSSHINHVKAEEFALENGVAIYSLATDNSDSRGNQFLRDASNITGGQVVKTTNIEEGVTPLLTAIHGQWSMSLVPFQARDQKWHSLTVKTSKQDVLLSAPAMIFLH
jgi:Mg-chelatase subunit ChlD